jgi:signal transduction histidine kinase
MYRVLVLAGAVACCCIMLVWRRPAGRDRFPRLSWEQLQEIGWMAGLIVLAFCAAGAASANGSHWPALLAVPATGLLIFCAPPLARRLMPLALAGVGLAGIVLSLSVGPYLGPLSQPASQPPAPPPAAWIFLGSLNARFDVWRVSVLVQSCVFLAVGLWLLWHSRNAGPGLPGRASAAGRWPRRRPAALLLVPVAALVVILIYHQPSHPAVLAAVAAAAVALLVVACLPAVAPDLAAAGLAVLGFCALIYVQSPPSFAMLRAPLEIVAGADTPLDLVAGIQGAAILALGIWLIPRTVGVRARTLLWPDTELSGRVQQLTRTRADAVDTAAAELRRVERDLHDGAQARLVALGMSLRAAERLIPASPQAAIALVAEARESSSKALTELRDLVRGMYPPVLADRGLADAVRALALDTPLRTETDIDLPGRLDPPVESACYFAVAEALTNAVKHSGARLAQVRIRHTARPAPGMLRIEVTDNGTGGADPARGSGLAGVERRLATFDGILAVSSPPGGPTIIVMEIPCAVSPAGAPSR